MVSAKVAIILFSLACARRQLSQSKFNLIVNLTTTLCCDWLRCLSGAREKTKWSWSYYLLLAGIHLTKIHNSISILLGIHRPLNANSKKEVKQFGAEYRSSKAKGDVKRKGKPDPYAYVPLQKSALNRRKKAKFEGQFKGLVNAANTGSVKGRKAKGLAGQMKKVKIS